VKNQTRKVTKVLARKIIHQNLREELSENCCVRIIFRKDGIAGKGTFGLVQKVKILKITNVDSDSMETSDSGTSFEFEYLAMKTVQLKKRESRELIMLKKMNHENIINLRFFYFSHSKSLTDGNIYLNLLFDIHPTTFHDEIQRRSSTDDSWSEKELVSFSCQIASGLQYLHSLFIAHRDIKPRNLLLSPASGLVQICDLGSACHVNTGAPLTAYICSRFYRAPELLLGAREYGTEVDMWSLGCVLAELVILRPVLEGEDTGDQLASIVDILGVPSDEDLENMRVEDNMLAQAVRAAQAGLEIERTGLTSVLASCPPLARLVTSLLVYSPASRSSAEEVRQLSTLALQELG